MKQLSLILAFVAALPAFADPAEIVRAEATPQSGAWTFAVTLEHGDTGWDDYADGWRVENEDGTILGTRTLYHPHVNEQPFTRSLHDVEIPSDLTEVYIRASTNVTGWAETRVELTLP